MYTADDTFANSLKYGLETLKVAYPDANIIVLSPYRPVTHDGGKIPYAEGGHTLQEYMKAVKETCTAEAVTFYDLYNLGTINKKNGSEYMVDTVHATEKGAFVVGTDIANMLKEMVE